MTATEMIATMRRMADELERMALPSGAKAEPSPSESRPSPFESRPAPSSPAPFATAGGWRRARLGKVFMNPTEKGGMRASVYLNYLENGEEKTDKPSTFDEELIAVLNEMPARTNVEYQVEVNKKGYLNLVAIRPSGR